MADRGSSQGPRVPGVTLMAGADAGWWAYYTGGRVYDSDEYGWADLPAAGMLGVVILGDLIPNVDRRYRRLVQGGDWYYLEDGEPACTETHSEWGEWLDPPAGVPEAELKQSAPALPDEEWDALKMEMVGYEP